MEVVDDDFLSLVEAAEAAAKKRKLDGAASAGHLEGSYTAALKGSKSLSWQQQTALDAASKPKTTRPSDAVDGNSCFKCGKPGHWARDCAGVGAPHDGSRNPASSAAAAVEEKPCSCGAGPCLVLTANTERNRGRKFYRCPVREENGGCGFFEWCDNPSSVPHNNPSSSVVPVPDLPCPCGAGACKVLTAKTEKNMGQQFYRCPANQGESCGFFKWCSEHNPVVSPPTSGKRANSSTFNGFTQLPLQIVTVSYSCKEESSLPFKYRTGHKLSMERPATGETMKVQIHSFNC
ncbi:hypothetical protein MRB53_024765 [Persea americana]|uniref:Uncharacterized protein n=1 Tax=Persea americana TaxID=3435 RepID=A0ACC2LEA0_PERAE|nr:hypothetical protein MRB53_024765 [Persea americana]